MAALNTNPEARYNDAVAFVGTLKNLPNGACRNKQSSRSPLLISLGMYDTQS